MDKPRFSWKAELLHRLLIRSSLSEPRQASLVNASTFIDSEFFARYWSKLRWNRGGHRSYIRCLLSILHFHTPAFLKANGMPIWWGHSRPHGRMVRSLSRANQLFYPFWIGQFESYSPVTIRSCVVHRTPASHYKSTYAFKRLYDSEKNETKRERLTLTLSTWILNFFGAFINVYRIIIFGENLVRGRQYSLIRSMLPY